MPTIIRDDLERQIQERLQELPPADWVREMIAHYFRTGTYRTEDMRRLLGDPNRAVEIGPSASLSAFVSAATER
jgi:hypothetical protein